MNLLFEKTKIDGLDSMKYECRFDQEFIQNIARSVDFPLHNYLYELN